MTAANHQRLKEASECRHVFRVRKHLHTNGLVGTCEICRCRVTSWPGRLAYDDLKAALDKSKELS